MAATDVEVTNLSKRYLISHEAQGHGQYIALRDIITQSARNAGKRLLAPFRKDHLPPRRSREEFWALKDVAFEIKRGDRLGVIGGNGAGKSTLLKILSRITEPTTGRITIEGKVASLLEVGTGFHPELTGSENIYLNGAILGMAKEEIRRKFDEIVAFAEIEKFLDTPVKRYSSGMYVRLAFSVAAHLEPEILIVDEVLAVGDAQFQKKCLGKMEQVGREGRTVIFVSHNMNAIEQLCSSCMLIKKGHLQEYSHDVRRVIKSYLFGVGGESNVSEWRNPGNEFDNTWFKPMRCVITDEHGNKQNNPVRNDADVWLQIEGVIEHPDERLAIAYALRNHENLMLYESASHDENVTLLQQLRPGYGIIRTRIPRRFLNEGEYRISLAVFLHFKRWICHFNDANSPSVALVIQGGLSDSPNWTTRRSGVVAPVMEWTCMNGQP